MIQTWSYRWASEIFHEFGKQVCGLESAQVRKEEAVTRHFCLSCIAQSLVQRAPAEASKSERCAFAATYSSNPHPAIALGLTALALTLVAAIIQRAGISLHPVYFNHNALYHPVQTVALFMIFWSVQYVAGV